MGVKKISSSFRIAVGALFLILFISIGFVSAQENADTNQTIQIADANETNHVVLDLLDEQWSNQAVGTSSGDVSADVVDNLTDAAPENPDLIVNITNDNIGEYFKRGTLSNRYNYATFFITEDIEYMDVLTIRASYVTINGNNHTLTNTAFSIEAPGVTLNNFTLNETMGFEDNEYAAILVYRANDVSILNININFIAVKNEDAYAIYSMGSSWRQNGNLRIANCSINFTGNNKNQGRTYAVKLEYSPNAMFANNSIDAYLPLRTIAFVGDTAVLDSEFALAVGVTNCDNLAFDNNVINTYVNARPECAYPTLDSVFICDSKNCNFTNNRMYLADSITYKDEANYLYGLDIYRNENMTVENNTIHVETKGGAFAAGTAYPIQLTGPASGIVIKGNDLYSKSNGPNLGIYSQNFNGANYITILNNHINVTGRAGNHSWALVAGIEVQDDNDIIMGNLIEVHNTEKVEKEDNLYGISYSQKTNSTHSYKVVNNTVLTDGYYISYMLDAVNTTVTNNTLVRLDKYADTDYDPFKRGSEIGEDTDSSKNNNFAGNRVITIFEHDLEKQSNEIDGGDVFEYETPTNINNISNTINGSGIAPDTPNFPSHNPLIPGSSGGNTIPSGSNNPGSGNSFGPDVPDGDPSFKDVPGLKNDNGKSLSKKNGADNGNGARSYWDVQDGRGNENFKFPFDNGANNQDSYSDGRSSDVSYSKLAKYENSSSSISPSVNGAASSGSNSKSASSSSAGAGSSSVSKSASKAYEIIKEIEEEDPNSFLIFIGFAIICEILLIVGYRRKSDEI